MNWKKKILEIENGFGGHLKKDWMTQIIFLDSLLEIYPQDCELHIRAIYILHNILVEEEYEEKDTDEMINLLQKWFRYSREKILDNAEYLFFIGKVLHIAEWFFDLEDNKVAFKFQKMAMEKEPENLIYKWAYVLSISGEEEGYIANQVIENHKDKVLWLSSKGFPGNYFLEQLRLSNEQYLQNTA